MTTSKPATDNFLLVIFFCIAIMFILLTASGVSLNQLIHDANTFFERAQQDLSAPSLSEIFNSVQNFFDNIRDSIAKKLS